MKTKAIVRTAAVLLIAAFALASCSRVKSAVGIDRLENGDAAILPKDEDGIHEEPQEVSYGEELDISLEGDIVHQIGEPVKRLSGEDSVLQYSLTNLKVNDKLRGAKKSELGVDTEVIDHEIVPVYNIDEYIEDDGTLSPDCLYVTVDVTVKYLSGKDETVKELYNRGLEYNYFPSKGVERVITVDGIKYVDTVYLDENGEPWKQMHNIGSYFSMRESTGSKEDDYYTLKLGEEITWTEGIVVEKELYEKYGLAYSVHTGSPLNWEEIEPDALYQLKIQDIISLPTDIEKLN